MEDDVADSSSMAPTTLKPRAKTFTCTNCGKRFGRLDHLKRHSLSHGKKKDLLCHTCGKAFLRQDALRRHEAVHTTGHTLLQKGERACTRCAAAKSRCSGDEPCTRCRRRNSVCDYIKVQPQIDNAVQSSNGVVDGAQYQDSTPFSPIAVQDGTSVNFAAQHDMPLNSMDIADPLSVNLDYFDATGWSKINWFGEVLDGQMEFSSLQSLPQQLQARTVVSPSACSFPSDASMLALLGDSFSSPIDPLPDISRTPNLDQVRSPSKANISFERGQYYVDGEPARLTRLPRRLPHLSQHQLVPAISATSNARTTSYSLSCAEEASSLLPNSSFVMPTSAYIQLTMWYAQLCVQPQVVGIPFEDATFPSAALFEHLTHLYFKHFDATLPILHPTTIFNTPHTALLMLSLGAIGCHYLEDELASFKFTISLQEFVARVIKVYMEDGDPRRLEDETFARICLLHALSAAYSGDPRLSRHALQNSNVLATAYRCARNNLASQVSKVSHGGSILEQQWKAWLAREHSIRLAHASWLLDYMWKYHFEVHPTLTLSDASVLLPCATKLWEAQDSTQWLAEREHSTTKSVALTNVVSELYIEKSIAAPTSDISNILLIHGILRKSYEVEQYYLNPLSSYEPTAKPQENSEVLPKTPVWLPSIPTFTKWQNSACDAIDWLHWQANGAIGLASGMEHPVVLHLHISRIVLLVPYSNVISMAEACVGKLPVNTADRDLLRRWVAEHQYKARLAVVHAGVTFWHVRRYSIDAFYEAPAVGLATLTLWAFATFANHKHSGHPDPGPTDNMLERESSDSIILLDRPTDDELVQDFIRRGRDMRTHLSEIGDLYEAGAAVKVLRRGCKLLRTLNCWGVNAYWRELLEKLIDTYDTNASRS